MSLPALGRYSSVNYTHNSGAGVGGLALAAFISRNPQVEVVVYESKPEVSAAGEAIAIWKRSWQVFQDMGLDEELAKRNFPTPKEGEGQYRNMQHTQTHRRYVQSGVLFTGNLTRKRTAMTSIAISCHVCSPRQLHSGVDLIERIDGPLSIPRPQLLEMLQAKLGPNCKVITSRRAIDFVVEDKSAQVSVIFSDGTRDTADIVIGADGVHSTTRKWFFTDLANQQTDPVKAEAYLQLVPPKWSGTYAYRCNVLAEALQAKFPGHRALTNPYIVSDTSPRVLRMLFICSLSQWCGQDKVKSGCCPSKNVAN